MKKIILPFLILLLIGAQKINAQDRKTENHRATLYVTVLGAGYQEGTFRDMRFGGGAGTKVNAAGFSVAPNACLLFGNKFRFGVEAGYDFQFYTIVKAVNEGQNLASYGNTAERQMAKGGAEIMFKLFDAGSVSISPNISAGTFWVVKDDFKEKTSDRMYGSAGLAFESDFRGVGLSLQPFYGIMMYKSNNENQTIQSGNIGLAVKIGF